MAKKNALEGKEILAAGEGYATLYPSYNATFDGMYINGWNDLLQKLEKPKMLDISIEDFMKLKESDGQKALALKFGNGGYECGASPLVKDLKTGDIKPSRASGVPKIKQYNLVVLDADGPKDGKLPEDFDDCVKNVLGDYEYYIHSTISSTNDKHKRRIVIPLANPITADVREACVRYLAKDFGDINNVDKASKNGKQLMVLPIHCKGSEIVGYHNTGKLFNALEYLPAGWEDMQNQPKWDGEDSIKCTKRNASGKLLDKETGEWNPCFDNNKLHYAFNKTYRISNILKESGKYVQESETRFSHTYDNAKNGIQVTNDSWLYSHYGTDCLSTGTPLDSYEVAMILRYGSLAKENWKKMMNDVMRDEKVKKTLVESLGIEVPEDAESWNMLYDLSTEEGIAQVCCNHLFPHKIRNGKWLRYCNGIYKEAKDVSILQDALQAIRLCSSLNPDNESLASMVGKANTAKNVLQIWKSLATNNAVSNEAWENHPNWLVFSDTIIDLEKWASTGKDYKIPFSPDYLLTQSCGYPFADVENVNPKALEKFLKAVETYLPDEDVRNYFQMAVGRSLSASAASEDKCIWMLSAATNKDGGNGKSTLLGIIKNALGGEADSSYYYEISGKYLYYNMHESGSAEAPSPILCGCKDRRFVNFYEFSKDKMLDGEKYKNYTSAGFIRARKLNSDSDGFRAKFCAYIDCNGLAALKDKENAILRRTRVIPFDAQLKAKGKIKDEFLNNYDLKIACMYWLMIGYKMYFANGQQLDEDVRDTAIPEAVRNLIMEWYDSFDAPTDFFDERYIIDGSDDSYIVFEECFKEYTEQIFYRGATAPAFRQTQARWLREHGLGKQIKKFIPRLGCRRSVYVGVYLAGTTYCDARRGKTVSVVKAGNNTEIPDDSVVKHDDSNMVQQDVFGEAL